MTDHLTSVFRGARHCPRRRPLVPLWLLLSLPLAAGVPGQTQGGGPQSPPPADPLPKILAKANEYCRRLGTASLSFICRERIDERQFSPPLRIFSALASGEPKRVTRVTLEYDYQLTRKGESIEEKRILLKENKQSRNEPDAALKTKLYKHQNLVFGPVGLLSEYWQPRHSYTYLGEQKVEGEKVFLVEAAAAGRPEPNLVYGKAWIRQKDFAIVKIEWDQRCLGNYDQILEMAKTIGHQAEPRISVIGYYGIEKNGIRFPDRLAIREDYGSTRGTFRVSETTVLYTDYKFFVVETEVRY